MAQAELLRELKRRLPGVRVYVGSGVTPENVGFFMEADGFIVGSYLRAGEGALEEREIDEKRAEEMAKAVFGEG